MKKIFAVAAALLLFVFCGCTAPTTPYIPEPDSNLAPKGEIMTYDKYDLDTYLKPIWNTREVYNETVLFVGENDEAPLLYTKDAQILSVRNYGLDIEYKEGTDYAFEDGKIKRLSGSNIPYFEIDDYYRTTPDSIEIKVVKENVEFELDGDRYLKYGEKDTFTSKQIAVTYTHSQAWNGPEISGQSDKLQNFLSKLSSAKSASITVYGDSISTGCNSSGTEMGGNVSPFADSYPIMIKKYLEKKFDATITLNNVSVAGWSTSQGLEKLPSKVLNTDADLVILAFGMNDGSTPVSDYKSMISQMTDAITQKNPLTDIVTVGTMLPNPESNWFGNQEKYVDALLDLSLENSNIACANVTSVYRFLLSSGIRYRDITANNINHPGDFVARVYAQVILKTMLGDNFTI